MVVIGQQGLSQLAIVGQLAVEAEAKPFSLLQMVTLERLGIAAILLATGGVSNVPDGGPAFVLLHQRFGFAPMTQPKHFRHAPQLAVGIDQLLPSGRIAGHAG